MAKQLLSVAAIAMPPKNAQAKKASQKAKAAAKRPVEKEPESSPRRVSTRTEESQESPHVGGSTTASPSPSRQLMVKASPARLQVDFRASSGGQSSLEEGLVRLRRNSQLCDVNITSGFGKIPAHRAVLAAHSEVLARQLQDTAELDLHQASHEAVDLVVKFCYGEVREDAFVPTSSKVNEEILKISSDFGLPALSDLCAARLAAEATTANVVASVRLCEDYGLPRLRTALVKGIVEDPLVLDAVAKDPVTLTHPALMRELLAYIASKA